MAKALNDVVKNILNAIGEKNKNVKKKSSKERKEQSVRLAIATQDGMVSAHFGHCQAYTLVDIEDGSATNTNAIPAPPHQPGILPPFLADKGANIVIAGGMGPRAVELFEAQGIKVISGVQGSIDQVVEAYIAGTLKSGENLCDSHHGDGHDCGDNHGEGHSCDH